VDSYLDLTVAFMGAGAAHIPSIHCTFTATGLRLSLSKT